MCWKNKTEWILYTIGIILKLTISVQPNLLHNVGIWMTTLDNFILPKAEQYLSMI